ncbi:MULTISPECIES: glycosyltransferase family 2 protein [unclassified Pseudomonas]|uniref:glycosyltransferase family 2 protein n=1 Tax=unclassified Pseudomonas TaxID=196821 RepID=UPI001F5AB99A|nr:MULTISPECIES: glycosyltransferase family 2 protein [unclassified Pseudomonas]
MEHQKAQAVLSVKQPRQPTCAYEVAILLCTYNGKAFLKSQIDSFVEQTHKKWTLYISDDGSTDGTLSILEEYKALIEENRIRLFTGPRAGFAENFMSLIRNAEINADFYAFSDQDDIWFKDKLERSIHQLHESPQHLPAMYCSRTRLIDEENNIIGFSPIFTRPPTFQNALIQSIAGANTMLINSRARNILSCIPQDMDIIAHDWLTYLVTSGCGGNVVFDVQPTLDYRQHSANVIGANIGFKDSILRLGKVFEGQFRIWSDANVAILEYLQDHLTETSKKTLYEFTQSRNSSILTRLRLANKSGIYRQTLKGNISLFLAVLLNKI